MYPPQSENGLRLCIYIDRIKAVRNVLFVLDCFV